MSAFKTLAEFWYESEKWSLDTFGPYEVRGPVGPILHLKKEQKEAADQAWLLHTKDPAGSRERLLEELVDCLFLVFDALRRARFGLREVADAAFRKLDKNRMRVWPDWRTVDPLAAIQHDRTADTEVTR